MCGTSEKDGASYLVQSNC